MRLTLLIVVILAWLFCIVAGEVVPSSLSNISIANHTTPETVSTAVNSSNEKTVHVAFDDPSSEDEYSEDDDNPEEIWQHASCKGARLLLGTTLNLDQAILHCRPLTSPWQGPLYNELATWGYAEDTEHDNKPGECDFANKYRLKTVFDALGIDTRSHVDGGPNHCLYVKHANGPAVERKPDGTLPSEGRQIYRVNGKIYRVTGAHFHIGINGQDGYIYFLDRASPASEARVLWDIVHGDPVPADQLPALRASSDIAWGFWNRFGGHNLGNINGFFSVSVVNHETKIIIEEALKRKGLVDWVPQWPGVQFNSGSEEYNVLLGSPNGLAVGYFLAQRKREMGGNKYVSYIVVFKDDRQVGYIDLFFKVDWAPSPPRPPPGLGSVRDRHMERDSSELPSRNTVRMESGKLLPKSRDGKHMVREHVIWAS